MPVTDITTAQANQILDLIDRAAKGEEIILSKGETRIAKLGPYLEKKEEGILGGWTGKVWMAPDFDENPPGFEDFMPSSED